VSKQVDGIIYLGHSLSESSKNYLKDIKIPVVLAGNLGVDSEFYSVNIDYEKASFEVTKEFLEKGAKNISLIIDKYESQKTQRIIKGYKDALATKKIEFDPSFIIDGYQTYKESNRIFKTLSNIDAKVDVVIAMYDEVALAVLHQALDTGLKVPHDFELISLENTKLLDMTRPKISSIFQPIFDIGAVSMRVLTKIIDIEKAMSDPNRIREIVSYIIDHFEQKTMRNKHYELKDQRLSGFNSIFAVSSIPVAKKYYLEFKKQLEEKNKNLTIATIFSYSANEEENTDNLDDESFDTENLDLGSREFLEEAISDYNKMFGTNYDTSSDGFQLYYENLSKRTKDKEIDILKNN